MAAQAKTEKLLFPSRAKEEVERREAGEEQARAVAEFEQHASSVRGWIDDLLDDARGLEAQVAALAREKAQLEEGNPLLPIETQARDACNVSGACV